MQWEYLTTFLEAEARYEEDFLRQLSDWKSGIPVYTPESLILRLNAYGEQGWELIQMQPVALAITLTCSCGCRARVLDAHLFLRVPAGERDGWGIGG
ncbi:MAG: hypothetical protein U0521_06460 [Anaerolineae bacterium]